MNSFNKKTDPEICFFSDGCFYQNRSCQKSRNAGFTLVEIMIVVAIISVLSALAYPSLSTLFPRYKTKSAARELRNYLQTAKLEAINRNTDCLIVFTQASGTDPGSCMGCISSDGTCTVGVNDIIFKVDFNDFNWVTLSNVTFTGNKFVFNARGIPKTTTGGMAAGRAVIQNTAETGYSFDVIVASSGRIRIE